MQNNAFANFLIFTCTSKNAITNLWHWDKKVYYDSNPVKHSKENSC